MTNDIDKRMVNFLLEHTFRSKKDMAQQIGVPYRALLKVCTGHASKRSIMQVTDRMLYYCIMHQIPISNALE